jgi:hypothetical protein
MLPVQRLDIAWRYRGGSHPRSRISTIAMSFAEIAAAPSRICEGEAEWPSYSTATFIFACGRGTIWKVHDALAVSENLHEQKVLCHSAYLA